MILLNSLKVMKHCSTTVFYDSLIHQLTSLVLDTYSLR